MLAGMIRGGMSPDEACRNLQHFVPRAIVQEARKEYEQQCGIIRTLREPASIHGNSIRDWYAGPAEGDVFWPALTDELLRKRWNQADLSLLDDASTKVVSLLQPPGLGAFQTRGLVVGYVQSGKTTNFTAVISKAADVGYRFFIVLSGVHNSLRSQTQLRLEEQLVRLNQDKWVCVTSQEQDFRRQQGGNINAFLARTHDLKLLCVMKKNGTVLRKFLEWIDSATPETLSNCPVIIIDDESDLASVNTRSDEQPAVINARIRGILARLPKAAYIGYTATPFANFFIDPSSEADLFPRDFIVDLPAPEAYFGPERIFGRERLDTDGDDLVSGGMDLIRSIPDDEALLLRSRTRAAVYTFKPSPVPTLVNALRYFWMATAARTVGDQMDSIRSSMLIHTSMNTVVHERTKPLIELEQQVMLGRLRRNEQGLLDELRQLWVEERAAAVGGDMPCFEQLLPYLSEVIASTSVLIRNSQHPQPASSVDEPQVQIIIGGNVLSRGVTLEGLVVSYFLRTASAYDTLLQMGRWFGYRQGYEDLPRIWMTTDLQEHFVMLATVEQEIRNDIRRYNHIDVTPRDFGVRVRTHPKLAITAKAKMQHAVDASMSYGDTSIQTILFNHRDHDWLLGNLEAGRALIDGAQGQLPIARHHDRVVFRGVPVGLILNFLSAYQFHEESRDQRNNLVTGYIRAENALGGLKLWDIAIVGTRQQHPTRGRAISLGTGIDVPLLTRSKLKYPEGRDYANIGVLASPRERNWPVEYVSGIDIVPNKNAPEAAPLACGTLLLYPINKDSRPLNAADGARRPRVSLDAVEDVLGACIVFPTARGNTAQSYKTVDLSKVEREEVDDLEGDPAA